MGFFWRKKEKPREQPDMADAPARDGEPAVEAQAEPAPPAEAPEAAPPMAAPEPPPETIPAPEPQPDEPPADEPAPVPEDAPKKKGIFARMAERLVKTREKLSGAIDVIAVGRKIDDQVLDELEEALVTADLGVKTSLALIADIRGQVRRQELKDVEALKAALRQGIEKVLADVAPAPRREANPHVIMVVGVNGVGKTTSIAKLAHYFQGQGRKVLLGAADTFRAAAAEQLEIWAQRTGCDIVRQQHGSDPSAVAFDAIDAAVKRGADLVIIDTAGRLHTKVNLMDEMKKIQRVMNKRLPGAPHEVLLVLDATTGQNAISQAKLFHQAVPLSGLILTKLDGTAKGGVVVAIAAELKLPILFVGLGEGMDDLKPFDPSDFAEAIF
jgi:fused signal recognition particle receptor